MCTDNIYKRLPEEIQTQVDDKVKQYRKREFKKTILDGECIAIEGYRQLPMWLLKRRIKTFITTKNLKIPKHQDFLAITTEQKHKLSDTNNGLDWAVDSIKEFEQLLEFCPEIDLNKLINYFLDLLERHRLVWCYTEKKYVEPEECCHSSTCVELYRCDDFWTHYWNLTQDVVDEITIDKINEDVNELIDALLQNRGLTKPDEWDNQAQIEVVRKYKVCCEIFGFDPMLLSEYVVSTGNEGGVAVLDYGQGLNYAYIIFTGITNAIKGILYWNIATISYEDY